MQGLLLLLTVNSCLLLPSPQQKAQVDQWLVAINGPGAVSQTGPVQKTIDRRAEEQDFQLQERQFQPQQIQERQFQPKQLQERQFQPQQSAQRRYEQEPLQQPEQSVQEFLPEAPAQQPQPQAVAPRNQQVPPQQQNPNQQIQQQNPNQQFRPRPRQSPAQRQPPSRRQPYPGQRRPPPGRRPAPGRRPLNRNRQKQNNGLLGGIGNAVGAVNNAVKGAVKGVTDTFSCEAGNLYAESKLQDEDFILSQMRCLQGLAPCDDTGKQIRVLAPEVLQNRCPKCGRCTKQQIKRVMSEVQQNYPEEWNKALTEIRKNMRRPG